MLTTKRIEELKEMLNDLFEISRALLWIALFVLLSLGSYFITEPKKRVKAEKPPHYEQKQEKDSYYARK